MDNVILYNFPDLRGWFLHDLDIGSGLDNRDINMPETLQSLKVYLDTK